MAFDQGISCFEPEMQISVSCFEENAVFHKAVTVLLHLICELSESDAVMVRKSSNETDIQLCRMSDITSM